MEKKPTKVSKEQPKEIVSESVKTVLTDIGISTKLRNGDNVIWANRKGAAGYNGIKTIAVLIAQNHGSADASHAFDKRVNHSLLKSLKDAHYVCVPVEGHWAGTPEMSFAVLNISLDAAVWFNGHFRQTGFIYSTVVGNSIESRYYEEQDMTEPYNRKTNPYVIKESANCHIDLSGAESDVFVVGKMFGYRIESPTLKYVNEIIAGNFTEELKRGKKSLFHDMTLDEEIDFTINRVGQSPSIHRGRLYRGLIQ